jgi:hypothetical protein
MKTLLSIVALLASLALVSAQNFTVNLNGAQDGGGARQGSGSGTLTLSGNNLTFNNITYSGLTGASTAAHIHGPADPGISAGVLYSLSPAFTTLGSSSGSINGTLTLTDNPNGSGLTVAQQLFELNNSRFYINVHDATFPGGEIRGQILLLVPEPSMMSLGALGLGGLLLWMRRRAA